MHDRPSVPARDQGGSFSLSNPDDDTAIVKMFRLDDGLLVITQKCTYRMQMADQIDPERKNPALSPSFHQKLFDYGTSSELLCRTLLQAEVIFRKEFQTIDVQRAMQLSFAAFGDLVSMYEKTQEFKTTEVAARKKAEAQGRQQRSLTVPAVGNVRDHCKTFMQKADHFVQQSLWEIVRLFYPDLNAKGKGWEAFHELVVGRYGEDDVFAKVTAQTTPVLMLVRNARDCLEHSLKGVKTADFEPQADGGIAVPSIEIDFRKSKQDRCSISCFMEQTLWSLVDSFEAIIVHMCAKNVRPVAGQMLVGTLSEDQQKRAWNVRFAYGMYYEGGQFIPCG
jgi:hypothetical protein